MMTIDRENTTERMYMVTISINDWVKEFYAFDSESKAYAYYRKRLEKLFADAHTDVDDNGETLDDCVYMGECLLDDNYHGVDLLCKM